MALLSSIFLIAISTSKIICYTRSNQINISTFQTIIDQNNICIEDNEFDSKRNQAILSERTYKRTATVLTATSNSAETPRSESTRAPILQNVSCRRINLSLAQPQVSIVAIVGMGRLGNQLSTFASCYAIWKEYGMYHYLDSMQLKIIEKAFELPKFEEEDNNAPYYIWDPGK